MSDFSPGQDRHVPDRHVLRRLGARGRQDDLDFFQFPIIDPSVPIAEEAPTDGFFASVKTTKPALTKRFLELRSRRPRRRRRS